MHSLILGMCKRIKKGYVVTYSKVMLFIIQWGYLGIGSQFCYYKTIVNIGSW